MLRITVEEIPNGDATRATILDQMTIRNDDTGTPILGRMLVVFRPHRNGRPVNPTVFQFHHDNIRNLGNDAWVLVAKAIKATRAQQRRAA
jgi:hypothetical protein